MTTLSMTIRKCDSQVDVIQLNDTQYNNKKCAIQLLDTRNSNKK
jgi:hypothetical protein